jgi:hypothetical protein
MAQGISSLNDWSPLATKSGAKQRQLRMRQKAIGVLEAMVAALRMVLACLAGIEKNEQTTDVPFFSWNHNNYFASSDPHHDISKQLVDTTFV